MRAKLCEGRAKSLRQTQSGHGGSHTPMAATQRRDHAPCSLPYGWGLPCAPSFLAASLAHRSLAVASPVAGVGAGAVGAVGAGAAGVGVGVRLDRAGVLDAARTATRAGNAGPARRTSTQNTACMGRGRFCLHTAAGETAKLAGSWAVASSLLQSCWCWCWCCCWGCATLAWLRALAQKQGSAMICSFAAVGARCSRDKSLSSQHLLSAFAVDSSWWTCVCVCVGVWEGGGVERWREGEGE